jgi:hypothetical protein
MSHAELGKGAVCPQCLTIVEIESCRYCLAAQSVSVRL